MHKALAALAVPVAVVVATTQGIYTAAVLALRIKVMQVVNRLRIVRVVQALGAQGAALAAWVVMRVALYREQVAQVVWGLHGLMARFTLVVDMGHKAPLPELLKALCLQTIQAAVLQIAGLEGNTLRTVLILRGEVMVALVFVLCAIRLAAK